MVTFLGYRWRARDQQGRFAGCIKTIEERFIEKYEHALDGCWTWKGARFATGYGAFSLNGRAVLAHRIAYELFKDHIPKGTEIDHLCRNRACVNPAHLETVPHAINVQRGDAPAGLRAMSIARKYCKHGHPLSGKNVTTHHGYRRCKACNRDRARQYAEKTRVQKIAAGTYRPPTRLRTHCPVGHPYDALNIYWTPAGHRQCRACRAVRAIVAIQ